MTNGEINVILNELKHVTKNTDDLVDIIGRTADGEVGLSDDALEDLTRDVAMAVTSQFGGSVEGLDCSEEGFVVLIRGDDRVQSAGGIYADYCDPGDLWERHDGDDNDPEEPERYTGAVEER